MGRFGYTESEKELLRVLKMQELQLERLQNNSDACAVQTLEQRVEVEDIRRRIDVLLQKQVLSTSVIPTVSSEPTKLRVTSGEIPNWGDCTRLAEDEIQEEVELEDLLSREEFSFCVDDIERINSEFSIRTGIVNKKDLAFLVLATALQTARWIIIQNLFGELGQRVEGHTRLSHDDSSIKQSISKSNKKVQKLFQEYGHRKSLKSYKSWEQIIFSSAPYDTTVGSPAFGENLGGRFHRYKTLGHDPILGWIFGTANFITDTCTLSNFNSYRISRVGTPHFSEPVSLTSVFYEAFDSIREDWLRLPAGVFAQFVHLKSDVFTKLGLPVPLLSAFSEGLAGKLYKSQYDLLCMLRDLSIIKDQATLSVCINMLITLIHGMLYSEQEDGPRELYEVRTRKILCISNVLSSTGNLAYTLGVKDLKKLDLGGLLVSLYRLFMDIGFITRIKESYIQQELDKVWEKELNDLDAYFV